MVGKDPSFADCHFVALVPVSAMRQRRLREHHAPLAAADLADQAYLAVPELDIEGVMRLRIPVELVAAQDPALLVLMVYDVDEASRAAVAQSTPHRFGRHSYFAARGGSACSDPRVRR